MPSHIRSLTRVTFMALCVSTAGVRLVSAQAAQESHTATTTIKVQANLVVLDVVVTDAKGNTVPDLEPKDFNISQDGAPQTIRSFDSWTSRPPLPDAPKLDRFGRPDWQGASLNIFVLDELNTPFSEISYAAVMLKKFLLAQPALLASPSMLVVVTDFGYQTLCDYTRDRNLLVAKLASRPPAIPAQFTTAASNDNLTQQSFALLQQIALSSAGMRAHKNIIWIGRGFPSLVPSDLNPSSQQSLNNAIRSTVTLLLKARVTVYKIDPQQFATSTTEVDIAASIDVGGGTVDAPSGGEDPSAINFNFNVFAQQTGGRYFYGLNDLDRYIGNSLDVGNHFYTLSYRPPPDAPDTKDGTYHTIKISMNRPGLTATTRQGFYTNTSPEPPPTMHELGFALGQAATGGMSYTGVGVHVLSVAPAEKPGRASITFKIENNTLQWSPRREGDPDAGDVAEFTAVLVGLNAKHEVLSSDAYTAHPFLHARDADKMITGEMTVRDDLSISGKTVGVRVIVRDSSGRIGTADVSTADIQSLLSAARRR
jgi:VWFA-related protein